MIDGTYEYLTASFVDWLRLPELPFVRADTEAAFLTDHEIVPEYSIAFPTGVIYNGLRYVRSRCGKSFDLCDADRFGLEYAKPISVAEAFGE